ncbi:putative bifunctional methylthioribulose-1-phosphate dehydratase/enolase-phosphatase E1 [Carex littledalei]|uniref:Putative bifunctional methylthioribulose-1-phosphate dehydratase/enolase-phosphatase E1 n=1 Tax=Carex littledalei TaxID=544730 RepID=A0A833VG67_9POAL|nr:putative bifunctional methylthioribulose-1-phosphate dehydratase/enolase-phosphatase E1 [Carex littledalei]
MAVVVPCASLAKRLLLVSPSGFGKACVASTLYATHRMTAYTIRSPLSLKSSLAKFSLAATKPSKISAVQNGSSIPAKSRKCIVLDIEGTTTPISFVFEVLFPYARDNVRKHLIATYDTDETKDDIKLLRAQVEDDLKQGLNGAVPIPPDEAGKDSVIDAVVPNVEAMIKADRKIPSLKQLQGHIWRTGFESKEIQGVVFDDVPEALKRWHTSGIKVYIYSSGSREAQRLIFGNTTYGDLRPYLCGFFDTMIGNKRELKSYYEITQSVGVDKPSEVLFITDVYPEAVAANSAGLDVLISLRPGNAPLPEGHGFPTITSFAEV